MAGDALFEDRTMTRDAELRAFDALAAHSRLSDLATLTRIVATAIATSRVRLAQWTAPEALKAKAEELKLTSDEAATSFGNLLTVLERGPEDDAERALAAALWAHSLAEAPPKGRDDEDQTATDILWLATNTPFDALGLLDRALGDAAGDLWDAIADRIRRVDQRRLPTLGRGEALVGAHALASSTSKVATKQASALASEVRDPSLARALVVPIVRSEPTSLKGELAPAPRGPVVTTLLGLSGILFAMHAVSLFMRVALAFRRPAEIVMSDEGVRVKWRTEILGRTLKDRDVVIKREALARATREVRYPRAVFYAALLALAAGSYVGMAFLVDGIRAASPSLLVSGFAIATVGIALDFAFASIAPGSAGRCRVVFMPRRGAQVCVAGVDAKRADVALGILK
jgi:hypothetical protein